MNKIDEIYRKYCAPIWFHLQDTGASQKATCHVELISQHLGVTEAGDTQLRESSKVTKP